MIYIENIENHKLGSFTESEEIAKDLGWTLTRGESEIEQSDIDWGWYEKGFAPMKSDAQKADDLKAVKLREAEELLNARLTSNSNYPQAESDSFEVQQKEALMYIQNPEIEAYKIPTITGIAKGRGIELSELAVKILKNAEEFAPKRGELLGIFQKIRNMLYDAETIAEIEAIDVKAIFDEAFGEVKVAIFRMNV